jgi:hypothetical protein
VSAEIIQFVPRDRRERSFKESASIFRSKPAPDDLVMDHADTAPCEYAPWTEARCGEGEPA